MNPTSVRINNEPYLLHGKVASGEFCDVYYGSRVDPLEIVTVKLARESTDEAVDALRREGQVIDALMAKSVQGSHYFSRFLPQFVVKSTRHNLVSDGFVGTANVFRWRVGFQYTYEDIGAAYPEGVDGRTAVWLWKRTLDILGWIHEAGYVHGSVTPQHIVVHPRDHGSMLVGWSRTALKNTPLVARSTEYKMYYPQEVWEGGKVTPETDITMSARSLFCVLGGDIDTGTLPPEVHPEFAALVYAHAGDVPGAKRFTSAWDLLTEVDRVAKVVYGGKKFHPFNMPRV